MKVWVVVSIWDYEGHRIDGVYDSPEKAETARKAAGRDGYAGPDQVDIEEFEVG